MQNILVFQPVYNKEGAPNVAIGLKQAGYAFVHSCMDGTSTEVAADLSGAFGGRPPDLVLADLSNTRDCLPLRTVQRILRSVWDDEHCRPLVLGLLEPVHLEHPEWTTQVDDFLLPPYTQHEVLARIRLLLFRKRHVRDGNTIPLPGLTIDLNSGRAIDSHNHVLDLTPREYELLQFLASHMGRFFGRGRLIDLVWGVNFEGGERTVDIHVRRLRAKLPPVTAALLETHRGVGYGLRVA
jgi:DNA-binding response OmpR family regulator